MKVNVKTDYGAMGDGTTDDVLAIQAAVDYISSLGGGTVYFPPGIYLVSEPFYLRNYVILQGATRETSIIKNEVAIKNGSDQFCILIGNYSPTDFNLCVRFDIDPVAAQTKQVKLSTPTDANRFVVGDVVFIDSTNGFTNSDGYFKPYAAFINRVIAIDSVTGFITLEDQIYIDIPSAKIALTDEWTSGSNTPDKVYVCQNAKIKNLGFESLGDWTLRWGAYKCFFRNLYIKSTDGIGANGLSHCKFRDINILFSQKVLELATYSHDTIIDGLTATWWAGVIDPANKPLIKMGENVRNVLYKNLLIDSTAGGDNFNAVISYGHAFNNKIINSHFICPNVEGVAVEHDTPDPASFVIGNETMNNTFDLGSGSNYISFNNGISGSDMSLNKVQNNTFSGAISGVQVKYVGNTTNNIASPNTYL